MSIRVEQILDSLFATIPQFEDNQRLFFGYGEQKELNSVLLTKQKNGQPCYPLLWYVLPNELKRNRMYAEGDMEFVLAHNSEFDVFNDQRFSTVYNNVLFPHLDLVIQAFRKANGINLFYFNDNTYYSSYNLPNYGNPITFEGKTEQKQVDIWDAIKFKIKARIYKDACQFDTIYYNTNNLI